MHQPFLETPPKITLSITNTCNLQCVHCYGDCSVLPSSRELSTEAWLGFIDYLIANDFIELYIEGGEPLHRPDFGRLLQHCARKLMTMVRTNGTLLTRETASDWKRFGVGRVFVDVWGAAPATHDYLAGAPGSFEKSCAAVEHLRHAGIPVDMLIILSRRNRNELPEYLELAKHLGAERVGILRLYPLGRAKARWSELSLSLEEQETAIANLAPPRGLGIMQSWHPQNANCCWQAAAVNAFGDSIGCSYLREYVNFGNIRTTPFLDTWRNDPLYRLLRSGRVDSSCSGCHSHELTRGGCRSTAYAFHGRWNAPDPFCKTLNGGVDLRVLPNRLLQKDGEPPGAPGA